MKIELNFDMGESFGIYTIGSDEEVIKFIYKFVKIKELV